MTVMSIIDSKLFSSWLHSIKNGRWIMCSQSTLKLNTLERLLTSFVFNEKSSMQKHNRFLWIFENDFARHDTYSHAIDTGIFFNYSRIFKVVFRLPFIKTTTLNKHYGKVPKTIAEINGNIPRVLYS